MHLSMRRFDWYINQIVLASIYWMCLRKFSQEGAEHRMVTTAHKSFY